MEAMALAEASDPLRDLAQTADAVAHRVRRAWQVGHELARDLTADGRSMTPDEVALVQALERALDWTDSARVQFRAWWLDEETSLDETHRDWPQVWAGVADVAEHPTIVAHLSDLLWVVRHGTPHVHARRAIDAYLESSTLLDEPHDKGRSLMRARELASSINDRHRVRAAEVRMCEETDAAITSDDLGVAIALLDHLLADRDLSSEVQSASEHLLDLAWHAATRTDHVERLAKLLLGSRGDEDGRQTVVDRVVAVFRSRAEREEGFGRLMALREALRMAEELGHPAHGEILHEIETMDSESAFSPIRTEQILSRDLVANFCAAVVGIDSLGAALLRFAYQLPITPTAVQQVRDRTTVGIRHVVTHVRIGEANSVVTSTETTGPDEDPIAAAVERDVLQTVGYQAQMTAFLFLVPALHQTLSSYEPWTPSDVRALLEAGLADIVVADALARSLEHFHHRRYDEAIHVALPRVERLIRHIARSCEVATTKRPTKRVGGVRGLGEILGDLRGDGAQSILPEPLMTAAELTLVDPDSLNLRNDFLHGIRDEARAADAALILQLGLSFSLMIRLGPEPETATA